MKQRVITAVIMTIIIAPIIYLGKFPLAVLCGVFAAIAAFELQHMFYKEKRMGFINYFTIVLSLAFYVLTLLTFLLPWNLKVILIEIISLFIIFGFLLVFVKDYSAIDFANGLVTILYSNIGFISLGILGFKEQSLAIILYALSITMSTDIFAYEFGIRLGKHKLCPHISPKKSIEGSLFGLLFAVIIGTTVAYFAKTYEAFNINIFLFIPISLGLSIVSQIGDLVASKLKRTYDIKDYSNLFPGHGGVLDRFDSVIFVISTISIILLAMGL